MNSRHLRLQSLTWAAWLCATSFAVAQPASVPTRTIRGVVLSAGSRLPIGGAQITVGEIRETTDSEGRFTLRVSSGTAFVSVTATGYRPLLTSIDARRADVANAELSLASETEFATSVDVVSQGPAASPTSRQVQAVEVLRTPGSLDNVFRTLQTLPGVAAAEDLGSRLAVRGGTPDQNLTMMDGVEVHDPYRLFGLTSAFNPETIERFELATGGFSVKYGDRLSSLLIVENRDGRPDEVRGSSSLSVTDGNVVLEGGLPGEGRGSWIVTARRTYYDLIAERFVDQGLPGFHDLQFRGAWSPTERSRLTLSGLRSRQAAALSLDEKDVNGTFDDNTNNDLAFVKFDLGFGGTGHTRTIAGWSRTHSTFGLDVTIDGGNVRSNAPHDEDPTWLTSAFQYSILGEDLSLRQEVGWTLGTHVLDMGFDVHRLSTSLRYDFVGDRNPIAANGSSVQGGAGLPDLLLSKPRAGRKAAWLQDSWYAGGGLTLQGGVRVDRSALTHQTVVSPRLSATLTAGSTRVIAAGGQYTQAPGYEKITQGDYVLDLTSDQAGSLASERAWMGSLGLERDLGAGVTVKVDGYYKRFNDLLMGRLETEVERGARVARYDYPLELRSEIPSHRLITTIPTSVGRGRAYGFDVFVSRQSGGRLTGWTSYTWGRATREAYGREYPFEYDRRHAFATVASFALSPRWTFAATTRIASGFPRTAPMGVRVAEREDVGDIDRDGNATEFHPLRDASGLLVYAPSLGSIANLNNARLPVFARVDVRVAWRPRGAAGRWEFYAEVLNALNRKNAALLDPKLVHDPKSDRPTIVEDRIGAIPLLPTIGLRFRF